MADKKTRNIKVCRQPGYNRKPAPEIKLSGQWLREVGFDIGSLIKVQCEDGKLVILLDKVREEELEAQKAFIKDAFVKAVNAVIPENSWVLRFCFFAFRAFFLLREQLRFLILHLFLTIAVIVKRYRFCQFV